MSEDPYGNTIYKCDECSVSFIEGFDEERGLCDECAASIDEEGRQENIGVESLQEVLVAAKEAYHTKEVW